MKEPEETKATTMTEKIAPTVNQQALLEQYLLLVKSAKGAAAVELIKQVIEVPGIYVFGELLDTPSIQELNSTPYAPYYNLLNLFAYGTFTNYIENKSQFPDLTPAMINKLRQLTIVSLATQNKCIPYARLLKELDIGKMRELEDLIIDVIYADIVRGKLDQKNKQLEIDYTIGRDIKTSDIGTVVTVLQEWCDCCEAVLSSIDLQIVKANALKDNHIKLKQQVENEVHMVKKTIKAQSQDAEEQVSSEMRDGATPDKPMKKPKPKVKVSGKFWQKS